MQALHKLLQHLVILYSIEHLCIQMASVSSRWRQLLLLFAALQLLGASRSCAAEPLQAALEYARDHQKQFNDQLLDLIQIPSISALPGEMAI